MFRSSKHIYAQVIDDRKGETLAAASSLEKDMRGSLKTGANIEAAKAVGKLVAERASAKGVKDVVFDRGGYSITAASRRWPTRPARAGSTSERIGGRDDARTERIFVMAREPRERDRHRDERDSEFTDKLVHINRVAKVVKGGRRFGFAALVVVGDQKGRVGFGHGKAREVPEAIRKATEAAKRSLIRVPLREGRTLHHDVAGRHGAGKVFLRAAPPGTGIIAGGPMRAVFETLGMQDVVAKSLGSSNPYNMVRATFDALKHQDSPRSVAARRNIKVSALQARRREGADAEARPTERRNLVTKRTRESRHGDEARPSRSSRPAARSRRHHSQRETLVGLRLNKIGRMSELAGHAGDARHDRQGGASRARGGVAVSSVMRRACPGHPASCGNRQERRGCPGKQPGMTKTKEWRER